MQLSFGATHFKSRSQRISKEKVPKNVCSQINLITHTRENMKDRLRHMEDIMRKTNVHLIGVLEGTIKENKRERLSNR